MDMKKINFNIAEVITSALEDIPHYKWLRESTIDFENDYIRCVKNYFELFQNFANLSPKEVNYINEAITKYRDIAKSKNSASGNSLPKLWNLLGDQKTTFVKHIKETMIPSDANSYSEFQKQVSVTANMMANAFKIESEAGEQGL
jgi:hypothetical protein